MDSTLLSALISGMIAIISVVVSVSISRQQLKSEFESLRQSQFTEILKKRIEVYPKVWDIVLTYTINWNIEQKEHNRKWVSEFLSAINECHAEIGVYFSQAVYRKFHELQTELIDLERKFIKEGKITQQDIDRVSVVFIGTGQTLGLATHLKNDLGSYGYAVIQEK